MTVEWKVEGVLAPVEIGSNITRFGKLVCYQNGMRKGSINAQGWMQGCGLMGLEGFYFDTYGLKEEHAKALIDFLPTLNVYLRIGNDGTSYKARRYMFTLTTLENSFTQHLAQKAEKLTTFPNLAHGPRDVTMYLLTVDHKPVKI